MAFSMLRPNKYHYFSRLPSIVASSTHCRGLFLYRILLFLKPTGGPCFYCNDENHSVFGCTVLKTLPEEEQVSIRKEWHVATVPCWNCLEIGHYKSECPNVSKDGIAENRSSSHNAQQPPTVMLDVTDILKAKRPYSAYCHILADGFQKQQHKSKSRVRVIETDLEKLGNHDETNWNAERKSIFIVVD